MHDGFCIIIGDDHKMFRSGLKVALARSLPGATIREAASVEETIREMEQAPEAIDLVLLDLAMPGCDGLAGLRRIHEMFPDVPVAIVSACVDPETVRRARAFDASGYISKALSHDAIVEAVRALLKGEMRFPAETRLQAPDDVEIARRIASLTPQELRILSSGIGRLNKQIAGDLGLAEQTVKAHVSEMLRKLKAVSRTEAALLYERWVNALAQQNDG